MEQFTSNKFRHTGLSRVLLYPTSFNIILMFNSLTLGAVFFQNTVAKAPWNFEQKTPDLKNDY